MDQPLKKITVSFCPSDDLLENNAKAAIAAVLAFDPDKDAPHQDVLFKSLIGAADWVARAWLDSMPPHLRARQEEKLIEFSLKLIATWKENRN